MRVSIVLFALMAMPLVAATAQEQAGKASLAGRCLTANDNRSSSAVPPARRPDAPNRPTITGCAPAPDPAPDPGGGDGSGTGTQTGGTGTPVLSGTVWNGTSWLGMGGWTIQLTGTVTASTVSNADGTYGFWNLPAGTYTVCEVVPSGWAQTWPTSGSTCPTGLGYTFTLSGGSAAGLDFVDIQ